MTALHHCDLSYNRLQGTVPMAVQRAFGIKVLVLEGNMIDRSAEAEAIRILESEHREAEAAVELGRREEEERSLRALLQTTTTHDTHTSGGADGSGGGDEGGGGDGGDEGADGGGGGGGERSDAEAESRSDEWSEGGADEGHEHAHEHDYEYEHDYEHEYQPMMVLRRGTILKLDSLPSHEEAKRRYILYVEVRSASSYEVPSTEDALWFTRMRHYASCAPLPSSSSSLSPASARSHMVERDTASMELVRRNQIAFISHRWESPIVPTPTTTTRNALSHHPDDKDHSKLKHLQRILRQPANESVEFVWLDWWSTPTLTLELDTNATTNNPATRAHRTATLSSVPKYIHKCGHHWRLFSTAAQQTEAASRAWIMLELMVARAPSRYWPFEWVQAEGGGSRRTATPLYYNSTTREVTTASPMQWRSRTHCLESVWAAGECYTNVIGQWDPFGAMAAADPPRNPVHGRLTDERDRPIIARLTIEALSLYRDSHAMSPEACDEFLQAARRMPRVHTVVRKVFQKRASLRP